MNVYTEKQSNFWGAVQNSGGGVKGVFCEKQFFRIYFVKSKFCTIFDLWSKIGCTSEKLK